METPPQLRPQKCHFYSEDGRSRMMFSFIMLYAGRLRKGSKQDDPRRPNKVALSFAGHAVTRMWGWEFKEEKYAWHLERLRTRYLTLKAILENLNFQTSRKISPRSV
ncbi:hypothetical protein Salat_1656400 [Sesamum alatum]|uniref:Uncharacterized protein n=1 Tax=Sesamum alatum TaxID=300844 RepID=A0AAE1Y6J9_9LAMI|nr:hypothetical protein Salat_1656400 [Sesamum alatum]